MLLRHLFIFKAPHAGAHFSLIETTHVVFTIFFIGWHVHTLYGDNKHFSKEVNVRFRRTDGIFSSLNLWLILTIY